MTKKNILCLVKYSTISSENKHGLSLSNFFMTKKRIGKKYELLGSEWAFLK